MTFWKYFCFISAVHNLLISALEPVDSLLLDTFYINFHLKRCEDEIKYLEDQLTIQKPFRILHLMYIFSLHYTIS